jgi:hypothetical protein
MGYASFIVHSDILDLADALRSVPQAADPAYNGLFITNVTPQLPSAIAADVDRHLSGDSGLDTVAAFAIAAPTDGSAVGHTVSLTFDRAFWDAHTHGSLFGTLDETIPGMLPVPDGHMLATIDEAWSFGLNPTWWTEIVESSVWTASQYALRDHHGPQTSRGTFDTVEDAEAAARALVPAGHAARARFDIVETVVHAAGGPLRAVTKGIESITVEVTYTTVGDGPLAHVGWTIAGMTRD